MGPAVKATWDHLGLTGVTGFPHIIGNILIWASDQAGSGVAAYDISDLSNPLLLDVLKEGGAGGYWPEIYGHYIFFPRRDGEGGPGSQAGFMVVDFSDPTDLRIVANRNLPGSNQYVTFQDEYAFMNRYKIDMRNFEVVLELATVPGVLDASQFALPVGNLVVTGGYGSDGPGLAIWAHQAEPDTRAPFVAYHIPRPDQTNYPLELPITLSIPETLRTETIVDGDTLVVRPVGGMPVATWHSFGQGKLLTVTLQQLLLPDTTYEVILTSGIEDAMGNGLEPYTFRFSTGSGLAGGNQPPTVDSLGTSPAQGVPGEEMQISWSGNDPEGAVLEYRIDFGDTTPRTDWSAATSALHTYAEAGHYQVTVQVRDVHGSVSARSQTITIMHPPAAPGSKASSMLAMSATGDLLYTVNRDNDTVTALYAGSLTRHFEVPVGRHPVSIARASDGLLWVACRDSDAIDMIDPETGALVERLNLGHGMAPMAVVATPDGSTLLVSCEGDDSVRRFSAASRSQTGQLAVGPYPRAIAVTHDGSRALIPRFISAEHHGEVYDVALAGAMSLTRTSRLARDRSTDGPASSRGVPNYLAGIRIAPSGTHAYVVGKKDNTTRGTYFLPLLVPRQDTTVRAQLMLINLSTNSEDVPLRLDLDNSDSPTAVAFSPLGSYAFVTLQGNAQVAVLDVLKLMQADTPANIERRLPTGLAPQGIITDATRGRLLTADFMGRSVTSIDIADFLATGSGNIPVQSIAAVERERLHPEVLRGKEIFYHASDPRMSPEGYISCATCHADGGHDGRTWDFTNRGEGFRNTTDVRGRSGMRHGFVHWSANFDEIQDFENDIREFFGGTGFLSDADFAASSHPLGAAKARRNADLDALAAYVTSARARSLPRSPHRGAAGELLEPAILGQAVFMANNCQTCHSPSTEYTDGQVHNVGTLRHSSGNRLGGVLPGIRTPTLLVLHASAPYFHDGSAATLEEVFTATGGTLIQAEAATLLGGAAPDTVPWYAMKEWHQRAFVEVDNTRMIRFEAIASTMKGPGHLEIRYNVRYGTANMRVVVNGGAPINLPLTQPVPANSPGYLPTEWRRVRVPVTFQAGNNQITISKPSGGALAIDDVLFSTPDDRALASDHVRDIAPADMSNLLAYLRSLDGASAPAAAMAVERVHEVAQGGTDAAVVPGSVHEHVFAYTIRNNGNAPLNLGAFHVAATHADQAWVSVQPEAQVAPGQSTTLEVRAVLDGAAALVLVDGSSDDPARLDVTWILDITLEASSGVGAAWVNY